MTSTSAGALTTTLVVTSCLVAGLAVTMWFRERLRRTRMEGKIPVLLAEARRDSVKRSTAVVSGRVAEQLAPYLPEFPYSPREARFLGTPVDLVVFEGLDADEVTRVVFVEVKTGGAGLSRRERSVRNCVQRGDVAFEVVRHRPTPIAVVGG